ncbi:LuxR C-terminal-related transcriptional regulator [Pseudomonas sp. MWU12-2345]|uniref:LuxR C-terminal-related transcriptional regulator n=1 Tax=Pseudomonas sp. MWU12-2345 TaxID=2928689 RepID=UPI00200EE9CE|nr:LuxR C-terminal-related transcriptional regulator [Pseudomonas sp. MWU12-2345]
MEYVICGSWRGLLGKGLAERELHCVVALASGQTDKEIARRDGLSPRSIKGRVESAMYKLGVFKRSALVAEAIRLGLITFCPGTHPTPEPHEENETNQGIFIA